MEREGINELSHYNYHLPLALIAQSALHPRDHCKLLILHADRQIKHKQFYDILDYLEKGDVFVINETKVSPAKLRGKKKTGTLVEVILTKEIKPLVYESKIKGKRLRIGNVLLFAHNKANVIDLKNDLGVLQFDRKIDEHDLELPTPPYVKGKITESDYQTVFARKKGSLAAPTAGLHFTSELLNQIKKKGVNIATITLHISHETFLPVVDMATHKTGQEYFEIDAENAAKINSGRIIAVGTTVVKCLESCVRENGKIIPQQGYSDIFITPGYEFKTEIKAMVTNFHLPKSSLLLLTCAYGRRDRILNAYEEAIKKKYRFYSLGDAMMMFKE